MHTYDGVAPINLQSLDMNNKSAFDLINEEAERLNSDRKDSALLRRAEVTFLCIIALAASALALYYIQLGWPHHAKISNISSWSDFASIFANTPEGWGQFGDFIGGMLNPLVGICTIYLILISIRLQKKELRAALNEMKSSNQALSAQNEAINIQNFQNTFFNWVSSYREILSQAEFNNHKSSISGAAALRALYRGNFHESEIQFEFRAREIESTYDTFANYDPMLDEITNQKIDVILIEKWSDFKEKYYAAESSVKSITGLIDWILKNAPTMKIRHEYLNILASQLSLIEITFILYESFMKKGSRLNQLNYHKFFDKITKFEDASTYFIRIRSIGATVSLATYDDLVD